MIKVCLAGATGRMGSTLAKEAIARGFIILGALAASEDPNVGKTLEQAGICNSEAMIVDSSNLEQALEGADIYVSFTSPAAEAENLPIVADLGKKIVMGTTGFTVTQMEKIRSVVSSRVPSVFSPNFSIGINLFFNLTKMMDLFPSDYDFSIVEIHHSGKKDAPSGTAKKLGELVSASKSYSSVVHGREGFNARKPGELEIMSVRVGGVPGVHDLIVAGPHEMIRIEHTAFSRNVFAQGALLAAEWVYKQRKPGIYTMADVLDRS